jgi:autotransporter-associated beta strand protein
MGAPERTLEVLHCQERIEMELTSRQRFNKTIARAAIGTVALCGTRAIAGPYSPLPGQPGSTAISAVSSSIVEWASGATVVRGLRDVENPTEYSSDPESPMNFAFYGGTDSASIAAGNSSSGNAAPIGMPPQPQAASYAVALGQNGSATLTFNQPVTNGTGPDFAVFGNGFSSGTQEWVKPALVSVSSDGLHFFTFPSVSLTQTATQVGDDELDPTDLYDIAGNFPAGYGTPFDLSELAGVSPFLNVNDVTQVRVTSITGDINPAYATCDSTGNIINSPWPAVSWVGSEGFDLAGVGVINALSTSNLTWSNAAGTGVWDISNDANWNVPGVAYKDGSNVTFDNSIVTSNQIVTLNSQVSPASLTVNNSTGSYIITGIGGINGSTGLTKWGSQKLTLATVNTFTGPTIVNGGILELAVNGALPANSTLTIAAGAQVIADTRTGLLVLSSLNLDPAGKLDLTNNGLVLHGANLATITTELTVGSNNLTWNSVVGITSSTAAADTSHLTALGVIENINAAGTPIYNSSFDGTTDLNLTTTDVLVRYTYYGDANLDGHVDGSDYSLIDNGYLNQLTGWQNGDFNYDGIINGSDYTLIDNVFNNQGAALSAGVASLDAIATAQVAVPEPTLLSVIAAGLIALRRRGRSRS